MSSSFLPVLFNEHLKMSSNVNLFEQKSEQHTTTCSKGSESSSEEETTPSFLTTELHKKRKMLKPTTTQLTKTDGTVILLTKQGEELLMPPLVDKKCGFVIDTALDLQVGEIFPWLFVSSQDAASDLNTVQRYKFTHILSLLPKFELPEPVKNVVENFLTIPLLDEQTTSLNSALVQDSINFIKGVKTQLSTSKGPTKKILVHCNAGVSRSPALVILYLIKEESFSFHDAHALVKQARPCIKPNAGFLKHLMKL